MACSQTEYSALLTAWQGINVEMRVHISQPTKATTKQEFVKAMEDQRFNWESMFMNSQPVRGRGSKPAVAPAKPPYNPRPYYQPSGYVPYPQPYPVPVYQQGGWPPQGYNSYWENKTQQQDSTSQNLTSCNDQSVLPASKQSLMITADAAAVSESQPAYSNFR